MLVSKLCQVISEESKVNGEYEYECYQYIDKEMSLDEVSKLIIDEGFSKWSTPSPNKSDYISTTEPIIQHIDFFEKGVEIYYSLYFETTDEEFNELITRINKE